MLVQLLWNKVLCCVVNWETCEQCVFTSLHRIYSWKLWFSKPKFNIQYVFFQEPDLLSVDWVCFIALDGDSSTKPTRFHALSRPVVAAEGPWASVADAPRGVFTFGPVTSDCTEAWLCPQYAPCMDLHHQEASKKTVTGFPQRLQVLLSFIELLLHICFSPNFDKNQWPPYINTVKPFLPLLWF